MLNKIAMRRSLYAGLRAAAAGFLNECANVAVMTAILAPVLISAAGFAADFGYASYIHQRMNKAAEAAVLAAVSQSAATAGGGYSNLTWLYYYGLDAFQGNISQLSIGTVTPTLSVVSNGTGGVVASLSYSASVPTFFGGIFHMSTIPVSGSASATANPTTYINYYIVVDISQSMGIGATATDMSNLYSRVVAYNNGSGGETGCVFGCHVPAVGQLFTNEYLAHSINPSITLRIDSAVSAIQDVITQAKAAAATTQNIKIGLYTMSDNPLSVTELNTIASPTTNYSSLATLASTIDLGGNVPGGDGDSDFAGQLSKFNSILPSNGTGASAASPLNYVFIITDGLTDTLGTSCTFWHCTSAFDPSDCTSLKAKATVGVIYTTYLPIYNQNNSADGYESNYNTLVLPYTSQIEPNLQQCATSSTYFYQASDGPAITTGMEALFAASQQAARLTQ